MFITSTFFPDNFLLLQLIRRLSLLYLASSESPTL